MIFKYNNIILIPSTEKELKIIYTSYCNSFPIDERRNETQFYELLENKNANILSITKDNILVGYIILWELNNFIFIEHFEIFLPHRGLNTGSSVLNILQKNYDNIILETEPKTLNYIANKRVEFYIKNGFSILDKNYIQPSYDINKKSINLWLMGYNINIDKEKSINEIHKIVYNGK